MKLSIRIVKIKVMSAAFPLGNRPGMLQSYKYCDVPGSPCPSKKGESNVWFVPFTFLYLGDYLVCLLLSDGPKDPWPRVLSLPGARVVCWRPHPAGTRQYIVLVQKMITKFDNSLDLEQLYLRPIGKETKYFCS